MSGETWGTYKGEIKGFRFENTEKKRLGPSIGGTAAGSQSEIDRDSDGVVMDGTPDEKPTPKKPVNRASTSGYKPGYILEDANGQLQQYAGQPPRNKPYIREQLNGQLQQFNSTQQQQSSKPAGSNLNTPKKPTNEPDYDSDGTINDGTPQERRTPYQRSSDANYEAQRRKFVRQQLKLQGIKMNRRVEDRSKEERDARARARAAFDRVLRDENGKPVASGLPNVDTRPGALKPKPTDKKPVDRLPSPPKKYPPGQKPSPSKPRDQKPADRYPTPSRPEPSRPADRYPNPPKKYPPGQKPSTSNPSDRKPADRYPNPTGPDRKPADRYPNPSRPKPSKPADRYPNAGRVYPPGQKPSPPNR